ncbi:exonuclease domain-containing protein [Streptomyces sp. NPDC049954]|uniref:exonuclease domain-containing protein n=1 Tax=Streptomyces sp. NPDC049954 TaxID=3155779 RepID=UPI00343FD173
MTCWYEGPLAAFGIETTGLDAERDRIVSAAVVVQDFPGARPRTDRWLVSPGVPLPAAATAVHGLTDEHVQRNGRWPAPAVDEMARGLREQALTARPLVVLDAPFALTVLDRELRRHRASRLSERLAGKPLWVLDPKVLDGHLDRYRKGTRGAADLCALYGVERGQPHDPAAEALAALEVVRSVGRRFSARLERLSPMELHSLQGVWHAGQTRGQPWFGRPAGGRPEGPSWPLRPGLRVVSEGA